jgi:Na+/alanine symporter
LSYRFSFKVLLTWKLVLERFGLAVQWGVKEVYSNEAGQGTAAPANVSHPTKQGLVSFSVYIDTLLYVQLRGSCY